LNDKIYLPIENFTSYSCYTVYDKDTIRAYKSTPQVNSSSYYTDFYINSHYLKKDGFQQWGNYNTNLPVCFDKNNLTNAYMYRNDISDVLIVFSLIVLIIYIPIDKIIKTFFRGRKLY